MTKFASDSIMDAALDVIIAEADRMIACKAYPTTYNQALSTTHYLAATNVSGADFTKANGDTSGRKVTVGQKASVAVSATGSVNHIVLVNISGSGSIIYVTQVSTSQSLTNGNTMTFEAWDIEIRDPT